MTRVLLLVAALGLLILLKQAVDDAGTGPFEPTTLAAIGFVVLTAYTVGELGRAARLPRITGYILSGVTLGPHVSGLLSQGVVEDMRVFKPLALGLIALTAGLELDLRAIRKVLKTLLATLAAKVPLLIVLVGGAVIGLETAFSFLSLPSMQNTVAVAMILAVLGIGTSPAIVLAVCNEAGAKGRLTDLALAMAVVKDLVVVVALAVAIAIAKTWVAPGTSFGLDVIAVVGEELVVSLVVGTAIGGLFIVYLRFVHQEMLLVILVVVLFGAEISKALHLELLLVFIAAGFVVKNFSDKDEDLHDPLTRVALPVFVVFFTTTGAEVNLEASAGLLPLALSLVVARMLSYFAASRFGAWLGGEGKEVRRQAWLTYWPQAGITIGLIDLAGDKLPEISTALVETGFAVVAINLLVGPISVGLALRRAGEVNDKKPEAERSTRAAIREIAPVRAGVQPILPLDPIEPDPRPRLKGQLETEPLIGTVESLATDLERTTEAFLARHVTPFAEAVQNLAERMLGDAAESNAVVVAVRKTLTDTPPPFAEEWDEAVETLRRDLVARVLMVPLRLEVPLSDGLLIARANDGAVVRLLRWRLRLLRTLSHTAARTRVVRLQVLARHRLEPRIATGIRATTAVSFEHYARILDEVRAVVSGSMSPAEARSGVRTLSERWVEAARRTLLGALRQGITSVSQLAAEAGAPGAEAARLRLSNVQPRLLADVEGIRRDSKRWRRIAAAGINTLRAEAFVEEADDKLASALELRVREPLTILSERIVPMVRQVGKRLDNVLKEVEAAAPEELDLQLVLSKTNASFPKTERKRLERARANFGRQTRQFQLPEDLARLRAGAPDRLDLLPPGALVAQTRPERVQVVLVPFAERLEASIAELVGQVRDAMAQTESLVVASEGRVRDATHLAGYGVEAAHTWEVEATARRATAVRALARGRDAVEALGKDMAEASSVAEVAANAAAERAKVMLRALVREQRSSTVSRVRSSFRAQRQAVRSAIADTIGAFAAWIFRSREEAAVRLGLASEPVAPRNAGELRRAMLSASPRPSTLGLPAIYLKVFDPTPVEDRRIAVAHAQDVERVSRLLGLAKGGTTGHVIVEGPSGSGRTSFLNMVEREVKSRRVVRIDATFHPRDEGLVGALSAELGCPDYPLAVTQSLLAEPTLVVVDDLGHHVMPTPSGLHELEEMLRIVVDTARQVSWLVSAESSKLAILSELVPIFGVFTERHELGSVDAETLERVVGARTNLAGLDVRFPRAPFPRWIAQRSIAERRARRAYFERLAETSGGNLRQALVLHLRSLRAEPVAEAREPKGGTNSAESEKTLKASLPRRPRPPKLSGLDPRTVACLAMVARFGSLDENELSEILLVDRHVVRQHAMALMHAGLLERSGGRLLRIPLHAQQPILQSLSTLGLIRQSLLTTPKS